MRAYSLIVSLSAAPPYPHPEAGRPRQMHFNSRHLCVDRDAMASLGLLPHCHVPLHAADREQVHLVLIRDALNAQVCVQQITRHLNRRALTGEQRIDENMHGCLLDWNQGGRHSGLGKFQQQQKRLLKIEGLQMHKPRDEDDGPVLILGLPGASGSPFGPLPA